MSNVEEKWHRLPGGDAVKQNPDKGPTIEVVDSDTKEKYYIGRRPRQVVALLVFGPIITCWIGGALFSIFGEKILNTFR